MTDKVAARRRYHDSALADDKMPAQRRQHSKGYNINNLTTLCENGSALDVFIYFLMSANRLTDSYNYQVELQPDQELVYQGIGTLSKLLGISGSQAFQFLSKCGLVWVRGKEKKNAIKLKSWEMMLSLVPGLSIVKRATRDAAFILSLGKSPKLHWFDQANGRLKPPRNRQLARVLREVRSHPSTRDIFSKIPDNKEQNNAEEDSIDETTNQGRNVAENIVVSMGERESNTDNDNNKENDGDGGNQMNGRKRKHQSRKKREMKMRFTDVGDTNSTKAHLPHGYKCLHKLSIKKMKSAEEIVKTIKESASKKKSCLSETDKIFIGTLASRFPQASEVVAEQMVCAGGLVACSQIGLMDALSTEKELTFDNLHQILPCWTTIKTCVKTVAAHKIIYRGMQMKKAAKVFLGCDKGAGVLVKMAFYTDPETKTIAALNLDFDKSGEDAQSGGIAIRNAMRKYTFDDSDSVKFSGGGSDSGGGFTKEAMQSSLVSVNLVKNEDAYIHINCMSHNDQTNLRVAMITAYGQGALAARNALQLVHSWSDVQAGLDGTQEIMPLLRSAWKFVSPGTDAPKQFLLLMPEPILTRWGTIGSAMRYVRDYLPVLDTFCKGICGSRSTKASQTVHLCASNFRSLCKEQELRLDVYFLADFDEYFFSEHLAFNHATDPNIGRSGFLAHHHLVRYYLKAVELDAIIAEIKAGEDLTTPASGGVLTRFWQEMNDPGVSAACKKKSVDKAALFLQTYKRSLNKHNKQWISPSLFFLSIFGEFHTARVVGRLLLGKEDLVVGPNEFSSTIHGDREINLHSFAKWLHGEVDADTITTIREGPNYLEVEDAVLAIANDGINFYGQSVLGWAYKDLFLRTFAACPSTMEMVERSVKKARLCQQTGKGERSVTAYGIAGDGTSLVCPARLVASTYLAEKKALREQKLEKATINTQNMRFSQQFEQDIERGPGLMLNIYNWALYTQSNAYEAMRVLGNEVYAGYLEKTIQMLTCLENTGSYDRYSLRRTEFEAAMALSDAAYTPSARELESGVTDTPAGRGEYVLGSLLKSNNEASILEECIARNLVPSGNPEKVNFQTMKKLIKGQIRKQWIEENQGKELPDDVGKCFKPLTSAVFVVSYRKT